MGVVDYESLKSRAFLQAQGILTWALEPFSVSDQPRALVIGYWPASEFGLNRTLELWYAADSTGLSESISKHGFITMLCLSFIYVCRGFFLVYFFLYMAFL